MFCVVYSRRDRNTKLSTLLLLINVAIHTWTNLFGLHLDVGIVNDMVHCSKGTFISISIFHYILES